MPKSKSVCINSIHTHIIALCIVYYSILYIVHCTMRYLTYQGGGFHDPGQVVLLQRLPYHHGSHHGWFCAQSSRCPTRTDRGCPVSYSKHLEDSTYWLFETCAVHVMQSAACVDATGSKIIIGCTLIELLVSIAFKLVILWQVIQRVSHWDFAAPPQCLRRNL